MQEYEHSPDTGLWPAAAEIPGPPRWAQVVLLLDLAFSGVMLFRLALGTAFAILGNVFFSFDPGGTWFRAVMFPEMALAASRGLAVVVDVQGLQGNPRWGKLAFPALVLWGLGQMGMILFHRAGQPEFGPRGPDASAATTATILLAFVFSALFNTIWLVAVLQVRRHLWEAALSQPDQHAAADAQQQSPPSPSKKDAECGVPRREN